MKKQIVLFGILCAVTINALSQDMEKVKWGLKVGYNYTHSMFKTPSKLNTTAMSGGFAGVMLKVPFDNHLYFVPQADINYRGMATETPVANQFSKITEYQLRVAPLLQVDFGKPGENTLFLQFGPSIGFGITGKQTKQDGSNAATTGSLKYGYQAYGKYDASAHGAIGYETAGGVRFYAEYVHGLSNMVNTEFGPVLKYRTLSGGISFWLGK